MRAIWHNTVIAESDDTVVVGNHYLPADAIRSEPLSLGSHLACRFGLTPPGVRSPLTTSSASRRAAIVDAGSQITVEVRLDYDPADPTRLTVKGVTLPEDDAIDVDCGSVLRR